MKTQSTATIPVLQDLGTGRYYFHFDHNTVENEDGEILNTAKTILFDHKPTIKEVEAEISRSLTDIEMSEFK